MKSLWAFFSPSLVNYIISISVLGQSGIFKVFLQKCHHRDVLPYNFQKLKFKQCFLEDICQIFLIFPEAFQWHICEE